MLTIVHLVQHWQGRCRLRMQRRCWHLAHPCPLTLKTLWQPWTRAYHCTATTVLCRRCVCIFEGGAVQSLPCTKTVGLLKWAGGNVQGIHLASPTQVRLTLILKAVIKQTGETETGGCNSKQRRRGDACKPPQGPRLQKLSPRYSQLHSLHQSAITNHNILQRLPINVKLLGNRIDDVESREYLAKGDVAAICPRSPAKRKKPRSKLAISIQCFKCVPR